MGELFLWWFDGSSGGWGGIMSSLANFNRINMWESDKVLIFYGSCVVSYWQIKCWLFICSLFQNAWKEIAPLNRQRQQLGVCELRGRVFAIGGSDGLHRLNSVEIYSPESNTWSETTPLQVTTFPSKFILLFLQYCFNSTYV